MVILHRYKVSVSGNFEKKPLTALRILAKSADEAEEKVYNKILESGESIYLNNTPLTIHAENEHYSSR